MRTRLLAFAAAVPLLFGTTFAAAQVASASPAAPTPSASGPCGTLASAPTYTHVIWVWMENHSYDTIIGSSQAPYINSLASECGLAANYHNISHPSLPNYIAGTSGLGYAEIKKFKSDCSPSRHCSTPAPSIFGQGETWKAYQESMPSNCYPIELRGVRGAPQPAAVLHHAERMRHARRALLATGHRPGQQHPASVLVHHPERDQ
jgi:hypothetical protein